MDPASARPTASRPRVEALPGPGAHLTLLGGFRLWVLDEEALVPVGAQRLLALLALRGRMSRSRTAGTLWPLTTENRALANLRTAIWRVNHVAPNLLRTSSAAVDLEPDVDVDVRRLVSAAAVVMEDSATHEQFLDVWRHAPHSAGELLPDWEEEWFVDERQRLRQLQLHVLEELAERLASQRRYGPALEAALAALRADPLRESAHRSVIRVHLAEGNTVEARRALDFCRLVLARDAGVEPSGATTQLVLTRDALVGTDAAVVPR